jgi:hypothetical protein
MDTDSANIFDSVIEGHFVLENFEDENVLVVQSPSIHPPPISNYSEFSQDNNLFATGANGGSTWNVDPSATQHDRRLVANHPQRSAQQTRRPNPGEKSASRLGQEMRKTAQRVLKFGGHLSDIEKYPNLWFFDERF